MFILLQAIRATSARFMRIVRLAVYALAIQLLVSVVLVGLAKGRMEEAFGQVGAQLLEFQGAKYGSGPRTLFLNGVRLIVRSASSERSLSEVLDHFERVCKSRSGFDVDVATLKRLEQVTRDNREQRRLLDGVWRTEQAGRGFVACLDTEGKQSLDEVIRRLKAFARTGDLSEIGDLRFVHAEESGARTALLAMWTEGQVPISAMFPKQGDCPGQDPPGVVRPKGVERVLSTWEEGTSHSLTIYRSPEAPLEALKLHYQATLPGEGWVLQPLPASSTEKTALLARRAGRELMVILSRDANGRAYASIAPL